MWSAVHYGGRVRVAFVRRTARARGRVKIIRAGWQSITMIGSASHSPAARRGLLFFSVEVEPVEEPVEYRGEEYARDHYEDESGEERVEAGKELARGGA